MIDEIVAKVNDETITFTDLQSELAVLKAGLQAQIEDPQDRAQRFELQRRGMLRGMIQSRLMMQKAEELGMGANADVQVSAYLEYVRKESGIPNMEVFDQVLRRQGSSMLELRRRTREKVIGETLVSQMVYSRLTVMTQEVEEFYESNIKLFTEPAEVELAEILFLIEGKDKAQVHSKAEDVLNTLLLSKILPRSSRREPRHPAEEESAPSNKALCRRLWRRSSSRSRRERPATLSRQATVIRSSRF